MSIAGVGMWVTALVGIHPSRLVHLIYLGHQLLKLLVLAHLLELPWLDVVSLSSWLLLPLLHGLISQMLEFLTD